MTAKVVVVAPTLAAAQAVARDIAAIRGVGEVTVQEGGVELACRDLTRWAPDVLLIELPRVDAADLRRFEAALAGRPATTTILLTPDRSSETLLGAMRAGVREVVPMPLANGELKEAFVRQVERLRPERAEGGRKSGKVLAFMPAKGGAGATFLATSLGHAISLRGRRVLVIDLNLHLGDAAIFVSDQPVTTTLADLAQQQQRLDGTLLESMAMRCAERLWVLASPETPDAAVGVRADFVARVIELSRGLFDFVMLDLGRVPDPVTLRALDAADTVYLVAQGTLPFLHDGKRLINLLRELGHARDKVQLVINRVVKGGDLAPADIRKVMDFDAAREIPNSYAAVAYAINHGLPLLQHAPRDIVARVLAAWAEEWAPSTAERGAGGWLRGLGLGRGEAPRN